MAKRPNFVFIITDQHRADHLGCYGNPVLQTPHIDALASGGTRFDRFYVATPICMPNRSTLMTGRMPSLHGVRGNGIPLSLDNVTFVELLRAAGYRTSLIGKSHLQNMTELAPLMRAANSPGREKIVAYPEALRAPLGEAYEQEMPASWRRPDHRVRTPFYGFDEVELCDGHGDLTHGDHERWAAERDPNYAALRGPENAFPSAFSVPQAWRTRMPEELYPTTYITDRTIALIERCAATPDQPFFVQCSFPDPHHPFTPPGKYWDRYAPADVALPPTCAPPGADAPPHLNWLYEQYTSGNAKRNSTNVIFISPEEAREAIALTYGMIAMIDDSVGRIVAALKGAGIAEDTVLVFTSDHGDFMGDHGLLFKGPLHYDGLIRVPFIWNDPAVAPQPVSPVLSGTVDIAETILDRAGIAGYNGIQGGSLLPVIRGATIPGGRDAMLVEEEGQRTHLGFDVPPGLRTLVTDRWRMSVYRGQAWGELYDLDADPGEVQNLWDDPAYRATRSELTEQLMRKSMELADMSPMPSRVA